MVHTFYSVHVFTRMFSSGFFFHGALLPPTESLFLYSALNRKRRAHILTSVVNLHRPKNEFHLHFCSSEIMENCQ